MALPARKTERNIIEIGRVRAYRATLRDTYRKSLDAALIHSRRISRPPRPRCRDTERFEIIYYFPSRPFPSSLPLIIPLRDAVSRHATPALFPAYINVHFYEDIKYDYAGFSSWPQTRPLLAVSFFRRASPFSPTALSLLKSFLC